MISHPIKYLSVSQNPFNKSEQANKRLCFKSTFLNFLPGGGFYLDFNDFGIDRTDYLLDRIDLSLFKIGFTTLLADPSGYVVDEEVVPTSVHCVGRFSPNHVSLTVVALHFVPLLLLLKFCFHSNKVGA